MRSSCILLTSTASHYADQTRLFSISAAGPLCKVLVLPGPGLVSCSSRFRILKSYGGLLFIWEHGITRSIIPVSQSWQLSHLAMYYYDRTHHSGGPVKGMVPGIAAPEQVPDR